MTPPFVSPVPFFPGSSCVAASGCGGSDPSVPCGSVAVVDGTPITKDELDALISRAKKSYISPKRAFPKAGTADYQCLQSQAVRSWCSAPSTPRRPTSSS